MILFRDQPDQLVHVAFEYGEVGDLSSHKAWAYQGTLMSPLLIVGCEDASAQQWRRALAPERTHTEIIELRGQHGLNDPRVTSVDSGPEVSIGGECEPVVGMPLPEICEEAKFSSRGQELQNHIGAHDGVKLR